MPVVVHKFDDETPFSLSALNENFSALIGALNSLARDELLQFGTSPGNLGEYARLTGAEFLGQVSAPSLLVGPQQGPKYEAVHRNSFADESTGGVVKRAAEVASLAQSISNPPTQAEVSAIQAALNALLSALKNAAQMSSGA